MRLLVAVSFVAGLASAGCGAGHSALRPTEGSRSSYIGADEINRVQVQTAYDMIRRLRPNWLQVGNPAARPLVVYLDGTRAGEVVFLRQIPAATVASVEYLNPSEAAARYGLNHSGGAILVNTRGS